MFGGSKWSITIALGDHEVQCHITTHRQALGHHTMGHVGTQLSGKS